MCDKNHSYKDIVFLQMYFKIFIMENFHYGNIHFYGCFEIENLILLILIALRYGSYIKVMNTLFLNIRLCSGT